MKYFQPALILLITFLTTTCLSAQVGRIETTSISYEDQMVDALTVTIQPARKDIQNAFADWMDDRYDINVKGGGLFSDKNTRRAEAVNIPAISPDNISIFTRTEERGDQTRMTLFASRGLQNFIGQRETSAFRGLENVFDGFLSFYLPEYYEERVMEAQEQLQDLRDDLADTNNDIAKNEEDIKKLRNENEELRDTANKLEQEINTAERMLERRQQQRREVNRRLR